MISACGKRAVALQPPPFQILQSKHGNYQTNFVIQRDGVPSGTVFRGGFVVRVCVFPNGPICVGAQRRQVFIV